MKKIMFLIFLLLFLMVCITSSGWASAYDDYRAAEAAASSGDSDEAIRLYSRTIESGELSMENLAIVYVKRGNTWLNKGDGNRAMADFNKAIELNPKNALTYANRAFAWHYKGDYGRAITDYNKAIDLNPKNANTYYNRGFIWGKKGDDNRAIADYTKAIELNPKFTYAYNNRGVAWKNKGDYARAMADYNKALSIDPKYALAYRNRGDIFYTQANFSKAIAEYKRAIENNYDPKDYLYLSLVRTASKVSTEDYNRYLKESRDFVTSHKTEDWIRVVSKYYLELDHVSEGDVLAEAQKGKDERERAERLCVAYYYLGEKRLLRGDRKGAGEFFRKSIKTKIHYLTEYTTSQAMLRMMKEQKL